ncbi:unnamed protein product [Miscanthus lutarioriparius]|uniref:Uncharacterized protein n=1 Tax=Miscanthus lutarioriparius TaxID=422564 RepID=A0A811MDQ9_9POAL|nr:unnamed protein product [Miscanthus lutarioriparius]
MALRCAVKLGIPDAIHRSGGATTLTELLAAIPLAEAKRTHLSRLMRLLTELGVFFTEDDVQANGGGEAGGVYRLKPVSRLLVHDVEANDGACLSQFVTSVTALSSNLTAYLRLDEWFKSDGGDSSSADTPFMMAYGQGFWAADGCDAERSARFDQLMASDSRLVADVVVRECSDVFQGITMCCMIGAMRTVRILQRCREAIYATGAAGKVVIIEMVMGQSPSTKKAFEAQLLMDMCMMVLFTGKERGEQTWNKIFMDSGFTRYKIRPVLGARSVIELYP